MPTPHVPFCKTSPLSSSAGYQSFVVRCPCSSFYPYGRLRRFSFAGAHCRSCPSVITPIRIHPHENRNFGPRVLGNELSRSARPHLPARLRFLDVQGGMEKSCTEAPPQYRRLADVGWFERISGERGSSAPNGSKGLPVERSSVSTDDIDAIRKMRHEWLARHQPISSGEPATQSFQVSIGETPDGRWAFTTASTRS